MEAIMVLKEITFGMPTLSTTLEDMPIISWVIVMRAKLAIIPCLLMLY